MKKLFEAILDVINEGQSTEDHISDMWKNHARYVKQYNDNGDDHANRIYSNVKSRFGAEHANDMANHSILKNSGDHKEARALRVKHGVKEI